MRPSSVARQHVTALRALLVLTVITGLAYPLLVFGVAQLPGLKHRAGGSIITRDNRPVGSSLIGQLFTDDKGAALPQYFQSRPSAAGDGYDPTSTGASNLGPESVVDTLGDPAHASLLTQVCRRSLAVGRLEGVSGARPYCTSDGIGAVLGVFRAGGTVGPITRVVSLNQACPATPFITSYGGVSVTCVTPGADYSRAIVTPVRGSAPSDPAVPPDAVTASGSGLDYQISPAYAELQAPRVARERHTSLTRIRALIAAHTTGRALGFMGAPGVNVLELNLALDRAYPYAAG